MDLLRGNIVTVLEGTFEGKQGVVVEWKFDGNPDGPIGVRFGKEYEDLFGFEFEENNVIRFLSRELRKEDDWNLETKIHRLFRGMWHLLYTLKRSFSPENDCMLEACNKKAVERILVNCWGSVQEVDACAEHKKQWHGKCADLVPLKKINPAA